jgi:hypothetical protein
MLSLMPVWKGSGCPSGPRTIRTSTHVATFEYSAKNNTVSQSAGIVTSMPDASRKRIKQTNVTQFWVTMHGTTIRSPGGNIVNMAGIDHCHVSEWILFCSFCMPSYKMVVMRFAAASVSERMWRQALSALSSGRNRLESCRRHVYSSYD